MSRLSQSLDALAPRAQAPADLPRRTRPADRNVAADALVSAQPIPPAPPRPVVRSAHHGLFDDVVDEAATLDPSTAETGPVPVIRQATPAMTSNELESASGSVAVMDLPMLPEVSAAAPVPEPTFAPQTETSAVAEDAVNLRAQQIRRRQQQKGPNALLWAFVVVIMLAVAVGAALIFGRSYLFPDEWDSALVPTVDAVQLATGVEFEQPVPLVVVSDAEYADIVIASTASSDWSDRIPHWRALGLANGEPASASPSTDLAALVAVYDRANDRIVQPTTIETGADLESAYRVALLAALAVQIDGAESDAPNAVAALGPEGFTGTSAGSTFMHSVESAAGSGNGDAAIDPASLAGLPTPVAYERAAIGAFGAQLRSGRLDTVTVALALDDRTGLAPEPPIVAGDEPTAGPTTLGRDDWFLVLAARLPVESADEAAELITADRYQPVLRAGRACVYGTFQTATPELRSQLEGFFDVWVAAGPVGADASTFDIAGDAFGVFSCDPGTDVVGAPNTVDAALGLVDVQLARLGG